MATQWGNVTRTLGTVYCASVVHKKFLARLKLYAKATTFSLCVEMPCQIALNIMETRETIFKI